MSNSITAAPYSRKGFNPNFKIRVYRKLAKLISFLFCINGRSRWGNEFIQSLNPIISVPNPIEPKLTLHYRTGHGRLYWRSLAQDLEVETNLWISSFTSSDIFIDVGSNIGVYSLMASQSKNIKSYSFEMDPMNISIQHENIMMNNLNHLVKLFPIALSETPSMREVFYKSISPADAMHSLDKPSPCLLESRQLETISSTIATFSLDYFFNLFNLPKPTKFKLDVDGIELLILEGSKSLLGNVDSIMVEVDEFNIVDIRNLLSSFGFCYEYSFPSHGTSLTNYNILFSKENVEFPL